MGSTNRPMIRIKRRPDGSIIFPKRERSGPMPQRKYRPFSLDNFEDGRISYNKRTNKGRFYVCVQDHPRASKNGRIARAIVAYEAYHGVSILPGNVVHHVDEDTLNDSKENLQLMSRSDHSRNNLRRLHGL